MGILKDAVAYNRRKAMKGRRVYVSSRLRTEIAPRIAGPEAEVRVPESRPSPAIVFVSPQPQQLSELPSASKKTRPPLAGLLALILAKRESDRNIHRVAPEADGMNGRASVQRERRLAKRRLNRR